MAEEHFGQVFYCPRCGHHWIRSNLSGTCVCRNCNFEGQRKLFLRTCTWKGDKPPRGVMEMTQEEGGSQLMIPALIGAEEWKEKEKDGKTDLPAV